MTSRTHTPEDVQKIMESWRDSASDYERGFIDGMQKQMQSSVDKAVNRMAQTQEPKIGCVNHDCDKCKAQRTWVGLTDEEVRKICVNEWGGYEQCRAIEAKLKEKNT